MSSLKSIGSIKSNGPSYFNKTNENVNDINDCIKLAQKGMGENTMTESEMYNFFGYKDLNSKEIVDKINNCDDLLKYYESMDCNDKKMIKPTMLNSTKYGSIFGKKFPVISKFQELGCQNKNAFNNILNNACKISKKYPHGECWVASNDKTKNAIFTDNGDVNIYVTPQKNNSKKMTKEQLQIARIDGDIELTQDKIKALMNEQEYNKIYKRAIQQGKTFDEVYNKYITEKNNEDNKSNMKEISNLIYKLQDNSVKTKTVNRALHELRTEKELRLKDVNKNIENNNSTLRYIDDRISFLSNKIDINNNEYNKKSSYINYIKIGILVIISLAIIGLAYKGKQKLPQIKKYINDKVNNIRNISKNTTSTTKNTSMSLSFDNISKMINQNFS